MTRRLFPIVALATAVGTMHAADAHAQRAPQALPSRRPPSPPPSATTNGYIGLQALQEGSRGSDGISLGYPVVVSVEPASPAQLAGMTAGDTVLAYDNVDTRDPFAVAKLLTPGRRVIVRVQHNGVRTIPIVVGRPKAGRSMQISIEARSKGEWASSAPSGPIGPLAPLTVVAPFAGHDALPVAGVEVYRLTPGLQQALRVTQPGLLVLDVGPGTPAAEAGMRSGDVILAIGGTSATTPSVLQRAMFNVARATGSDRSLTLDVWRSGKTEKITLRW